MKGRTGGSMVMRENNIVIENYAVGGSRRKHFFL